MEIQTITRYVDASENSSEKWFLDALCYNLGMKDLFDTAEPSSKNLHRSKQICKACPVRLECLEDAFAYGDIFFQVRGGMGPRERQREWRRRGNEVKSPYH